MTMTTLAVVITATLAQAFGGQQPTTPTGQRPIESPAKGTATIRGRVTAADTGRPLRRARISVTGAPLTAARSTSTNVRGEFELRELPAGRFVINVARSGYMPLSYGQRTPDEPSRLLSVSDGQAVDKLDFALPRTGLISGRVVDETGEAVGDVAMLAMRQEFFRGRRRLVPVGREVRSDDTGRYRLLNIPPGEFVVMATLRETWVAGRDRQVFGYAPTFFPAVVTFREAARVKVALGQEVPNVDVTLVPSRAAALSGTAMSTGGVPLAGTTVSLGMQMMGPSWSSASGIGNAVVAADGSWVIRNVPPGEYQLEVTSRDRGRLPERATMTIVVQGADLSGLALVADPGGSVNGSVVASEGRALPPATATMRVMPQAVGPDPLPFVQQAGDDNGRVMEDGRFSLHGLIGPSVLRVTGLPRGWEIERIESSERDITGSPFEVRGGQSLDVQIVVSDRLPSVQGRVTDAKGNAADGVIVLFPADAARWVDASAIRNVRPDPSGTFHFEFVRPGDYLAIALPTVVRWQLADPDFLEGLRSRATSITVRDGSSEQVSLRLR